MLMNYLILLAHADDETLGCGGTVPYLLAKGHHVQLLIASDGIVRMRDKEDDNRAHLHKACEILGIHHVDCLNLPDQKFEQVPQSEIVNLTQKYLSEPPDVIITHSASDLNLDHRIIHQVAKIVGRPRSRQVGILGCEIPASSQWNEKSFKPDFYVNIEAYIDQKLNAFEVYTSEKKEFPDPFSLEGLQILAQFRGMESGNKLAEAFEVIRWYPGLM